MAVEIHFSKVDLLEALQEKLAVEKNAFADFSVLKPPLSYNDVGPLERDRAVYWLWRTHNEAGLQSDTFVLAVSLLDRFLNKVKVNLKYLRCATLTSYVIAAKTLEESEMVPSMLQLIKLTCAKFGPQDMTKMEHIILQKLEWNITMPTAYDFVDLFVCLLWHNPDHPHVFDLSASDLLRHVTLQLQECLCSSAFLKFKGSLLALALISCALEQETRSWFGVIASIQKQCQITTKDLLMTRQAFLATFQSSKPKPIKIPRHAVSKHAGMLSPIRENPFESEFMASQLEGRGGACAWPPSTRAISPTKRMVQDDYTGMEIVPNNVISHGDRDWPRPAFKKVRRVSSNVV